MVQIKIVVVVVVVVTLSCPGQSACIRIYTKNRPELSILDKLVSTWLPIL